MAESIAKLYLDIEGRTEKLEAAMHRAERRGVQASEKITTSFKKVGTAVAGFVGAGVLANELRKGITAMVDFDKGMRNVNTITRLGETQFKNLSKEVLDLSTRLGTPTSDLTGALYQAVSAGIDAGNAIKFMETAAKGAIAGITSTETAVDGLTTVINAFGMAAEDVEKVSDLMFTTIRLGKTTAEELASSYNVAASIAAVAGIKFNELSAAIATLTVQGVPTTVAMTQLRAVIIAMNKNLGDGWRQSMTFQEGLEEMTKMAGGSQNKLKEMIGRVEGVNAVLGLTGQNAGTFTKALGEMDKSIGATKDAFDEAEKSFSRKFAKITTFIENNMVVALEKVADILITWGERIGDIPTENLELIGTILTALSRGAVIFGAAAQDSLMTMDDTYEKLKEQVGEAKALEILYGDLKDEVKLTSEEMKKFSETTGGGLGHLTLLVKALKNLDNIDLQEKWGKDNNPFMDVAEGENTLKRITDNMDNAVDKWSSLGDIKTKGFFEALVSDVKVLEQILFGTVEKTEKIGFTAKKIGQIKADKLFRELLKSFETVKAIDLVMIKFPKVSPQLLYETLKESLGKAEALKIIMDKFEDFKPMGEGSSTEAERTTFSLRGMKKEMSDIKEAAEKLKLSEDFNYQLNKIIGDLDLSKAKVGDIEKAIEDLEELRPKITIENLPQLENEIKKLMEVLDVSSGIQKTLDKLREEQEYISGIVDVTGEWEAKLELIDKAIIDNKGNAFALLMLEKERQKVLEKILLNSQDYLLKQNEIEAAYVRMRTQQADDRLFSIGKLTDTEIKDFGAGSMQLIPPDVMAKIKEQYDEMKNTQEQAWANAVNAADNIDQKFISIVNAAATVSSILKVGAHTFVGALLDGLNKANSIANSIFGIISAFSGGGAGGLFGFLLGGASGAGRARQEGGEVTAGQSYVVGEAGAEMFVPDNKKISQSLLPAEIKNIQQTATKESEPLRKKYVNETILAADKSTQIIGKGGMEIFVPKVDGTVIPNDKIITQQIKERKLEQLDKIIEREINYKNSHTELKKPKGGRVEKLRAAIKESKTKNDYTDYINNKNIYSDEHKSVGYSYNNYLNTIGNSSITKTDVSKKDFKATSENFYYGNSIINKANTAGNSSIYSDSTINKVNKILSQHNKTSVINAINKTVKYNTENISEQKDYSQRADNKNVYNKSNDSKIDYKNIDYKNIYNKSNDNTINKNNKILNDSVFNNKYENVAEDHGTSIYNNIKKIKTDRKTNVNNNANIVDNTKAGDRTNLENKIYKQTITDNKLKETILNNINDRTEIKNLINNIIENIYGDKYNSNSNINTAIAYNRAFNNVPKFQYGTKNFKIPQGFPNDSFPAMFTSGEKINVTPANRFDPQEKLLQDIKRGIYNLITNNVMQSSSAEPLSIAINMDGNKIAETFYEVDNRNTRNNLNKSDY